MLYLLTVAFFSRSRGRFLGRLGSHGFVAFLVVALQILLLPALGIIVFTRHFLLGGPLLELVVHFVSVELPHLVLLELLREDGLGAGLAQGHVLRVVRLLEYLTAKIILLDPVGVLIAGAVLGALLRGLVFPVGGRSVDHSLLVAVVLDGRLIHIAAPED